MIRIQGPPPGPTHEHPFSILFREENSLVAVGQCSAAMEQSGTKRKGESPDSALSDVSSSPTSKRLKTEDKQSPHLPALLHGSSCQENYRNPTASTAHGCISVDDLPSRTEAGAAFLQRDEEWVKVAVDEPEATIAEAEHKRLSYLDQMALIISAVREDESHLLDECDQSTIATYAGLPGNNSQHGKYLTCWPNNALIRGRERALLQTPQQSNSQI